MEVIRLAVTSGSPGWPMSHSWSFSAEPAASTITCRSAMQSTSTEDSLSTTSSIFLSGLPGSASDTNSRMSLFSYVVRRSRMPSVISSAPSIEIWLLRCDDLGRTMLGELTLRFSRLFPPAVRDITSPSPRPLGDDCICRLLEDDSIDLNSSNELVRLTLSRGFRELPIAPEPEFTIDAFCLILNSPFSPFFFGATAATTGRCMSIALRSSCVSSSSSSSSTASTAAAFLALALELSDDRSGDLIPLGGTTAARGLSHFASSATLRS
mmetsp:Transcript_6161/g.16417  ORF Transcript_6161/g.16417 Transcript_6161/m.16417 type:complete len:267 (-) Transcript_6161:796-1596(-)